MTLTEWKCQVGIAKAKLDDVCRTLRLGAVSSEIDHTLATMLILPNTDMVCGVHATYCRPSHRIPGYGRDGP